MDPGKSASTTWSSTVTRDLHRHRLQRPPETATGVRFRHVPARDAGLVSATASQGACALTKQIAACDPGAVADGQGTTITIVANPQK